MSTLQIIVIATCSLLFVFGVAYLADRRDTQLMEWANKYEICVKSEYGVHPVTWYAEHGYYPHCNKFNGI